ncbi:hypothetical protein RvY_12655 [Ramazzottius varieornatus]|uniref:Corticotropin-releasing factor domain-containing protein n=1 Tax=Ramazzottius varieornatus TaxID=947166 RepID=A0A1D1VK84_RAMVA|nr:hypothetical protein RvY_12655 [Ramazzottius varieornatus]
MANVSVIFLSAGYCLLLCLLLTLTSASSSAHPVAVVNDSREDVDLSAQKLPKNVRALEGASWRAAEPLMAARQADLSQRPQRQAAAYQANLRSTNIFIRNNWEMLPLQLKAAHGRREGATTGRRHPLLSFYPHFYLGDIQDNSSTKRSPLPSSSDTGLTLSIMSPLDVLREKMLLSMANRRLHLKNKISSDNDAFLRKYG